MNYHHHYHAGNHTDVFKHLVLTLLLKSLSKKDKPFVYIDTHAGNPGYDLDAAPAQKTLEYQNGVAKLWGKTLNAQSINDYLQIIYRFQSKNPKKEFAFYPGSTSIAMQILRQQDRMIAIEKNVPVFVELQKAFRRDERSRVLNEDGYATIKALLPPKERRGLVLIDPPYEDAAELQHLFQGLMEGYRLWQTGIFAAWYPIKDRGVINLFHRKLKDSPINDILISEFCPLPDDNRQRLNGSGLCIINPPWKLAETLQKDLPELLSYLKQSPKGVTKTYMLKTETTC